MVAACGGGSGSKATSDGGRGGNGRGATAAAAGPAQKITLWVGWSDRELDVFKKVVGEYDAAHPEVTIDLVGGIDDDKITAALRSGDGPDAVSSFTSSNVGAYCSSGGWIDLEPMMKQDGIDAIDLPASAQYYTQYNGVRCALPILADSYGFYYNKDLLAKAGATAPPKTIDRADRAREEAHHAQGRRLARRGRVRPVLRVLPEHARRLRVAVRRAVAERGRQARRWRRTRSGRRCWRGRRS